MTRTSSMLAKNTRRNRRLSDWTLFLVALPAVFCYDNAVIGAGQTFNGGIVYGFSGAFI